MKRREFISLIGGGTVLLPFSVGSQEPLGVRRIGVLIPFAESDSQAQMQVVAFREHLKELGWVEGRNVRIDYRWAGGDVGRIRTFAKELVASQPDLLFARTTPVTAALLRETRTIPIVFAVVSDPVGDGFVASLARPGGNVTGFTNVESSLGGKWLELLKEINPRIARVCAMFGPKTAPAGGSYYLNVVEARAQSISVKVVPAPVQDARDIERAISAIAGDREAGLLVMPDVTTASHRQLIISLAARHRLLAMYSASYFAIDGGLISYGIEYLDLYRRAASYVDRILRGAKPGELPIQGPSKFELVVNVRTAKALGLSMPRSILLRADQVME